MANEKRLIDANALGIGKAKREAFNNPAYADGWNSAISIIESAPTVDAVEVVRCKDCEHYDNSEGICWCHLNSKFFPGGLDWHGFPEDGYCSYGERREAE